MSHSVDAADPEISPSSTDRSRLDHDGVVDRARRASRRGPNGAGLWMVVAAAFAMVVSEGRSSVGRDDANSRLRRLLEVAHDSTGPWRAQVRIETRHAVALDDDPWSAPVSSVDRMLIEHDAAGFVLRSESPPAIPSWVGQDVRVAVRSNLVITVDHTDRVIRLDRAGSIPLIASPIGNAARLGSSGTHRLIDILDTAEVTQEFEGDEIVRWIVRRSPVVVADDLAHWEEIEIVTIGDGAESRLRSTAERLIRRLPTGTVESRFEVNASVLDWFDRPGHASIPSAVRLERVYRGPLVESATPHASQLAPYRAAQFIQLDITAATERKPIATRDVWEGLLAPPQGWSVRDDVNQIRFTVGDRRLLLGGQSIALAEPLHAHPGQQLPDLLGSSIQAAHSTDAPPDAAGSAVSTGSSAAAVSDAPTPSLRTPLFTIAGLGCILLAVWSWCRRRSATRPVRVDTPGA